MKRQPKRTSRIPRAAVIPHTSVSHEAIDDYDLPPQIEIDYTKAKRNPYSGRVQFTHGGARKGAGRKAVREPAEKHTVSLYRAEVQYLRKLDSNLSRAIRKMIAAKTK